VTPLPSQTLNENHKSTNITHGIGHPRETGSLDQHEDVLGEVGVVSVPLKATSSDLNHVSRKGHHQEDQEERNLKM
jgi:hypothetical protein